MSDPSSIDPESPRDQLRAEAALWFARMRGEQAEQHRPAFEAWLARGAVHRAAYNRIGEIFAAGKALKEAGEPHSDPDHAAQRHVRVGLGVTAMLLIGLLIWHLGGVAADRPEGSRIASVNVERVSLPGHLERVTLAQGTRALLDTDSLMVSAVDGRSELSRLERGRARIEVQPGSTGHTVMVGASEFVSDGGSFDVWTDSDGSIGAQVLTGKVTLRPAMIGAFSGDRLPTRLRAGQRYHVDRSGQLRPESSRAGTDWPRGILEFRQASLSDVLAQANRYSAIKIVLGDPTLADARISGRFRVDAPDRLARHIAAVLSLRADHDRPGMIVLRRSR